MKHVVSWALAGILTAPLLATGAADARDMSTGFLDRTITYGGRDYPFQIYVPAGYSSRESWPAILFLHGSGERGTDGLRQTTVGLGPAVRHHPERFPAIIVFPQAPPDSQWVGDPAEAAMAALRQTMTEFAVDPRRVYVTGLSMGGHGTWYLAYRYPEVFAAAAPICGWVFDAGWFKTSRPVIPPGDGEPLTALTRRLGGLPTWIFHGEMDSVVPVAASREIAAALEAAGGDVRYTELLGVDHGSWDPAYASDEFVIWLFAQRAGP